LVAAVVEEVLLVQQQQPLVEHPLVEVVLVEAEILVEELHQENQALGDVKSETNKRHG
jgi:hypothetical protein